MSTVVLVGNPNCGKTTLFNVLTGSRYKVANYPGVTVDKKEGTFSLPNGSTVTVFDLPGTYALEGMSTDEEVVSRVLDGSLLNTGKPDLLIAVVDATNLERNLYLVSELIDLRLPLVIAVNMMDEAREAGITIYCELLSRLLHVPVVALVAREGEGIEELKGIVSTALSSPSVSPCTEAWRSHAHADDLKVLDNPGSTEAIATTAALRYSWSKAILEKCSQGSNKSKQRRFDALDRLFTGKLTGFPIMLALFAFIFQAIFLWAQIPMALISSSVDALSRFTSTSLPAGILTSLLAEGVVPGVGNVIVFVPQIAILFLFLGILEDCGYLSRAAFLLDTFMRKVGLQGRSFIPLLSSFACAVPGILSTRSIPSRSDRLATIMIAPLMSCSARLPVYAVLIGAFIPSSLIGGLVSLQGLVLLGMYAIGVIGACCVAWLLKKCLLWKESSFYVMEMPPLRLPVARIVLRGVYDSVVSFIKNAATIILACSVVIWFLASYPKPPEHFEGNPVQISYAGRLGTFIEPAIRPLGFNWEIGFAIISSFPAREVFVTGLTTVYNVADDDDTHRGVIDRLKEKNAQGSFSTLTALSLMIFYVFACQCMSTLAVCLRETGSWAWTIGMFAYMTALAYIASLVVYQVGGLL